MSLMILGVDVGGTNIDIVRFDGKFEHVATYPTRDCISNLNGILNELIDRYKAEAVGIGFAGWIRGGKVVKAPNIQEKFEVDIKVPFILENDANCFALFASKKFGFRDVLGVTVGTGIGSGIVIDGKIHRGLGLAGEIGHWFVGGEEHCSCGGRGHLECYFGGWSLSKGKKPEDLVESGKIYELKGFEIFCIALANAITLLDPEGVVVGGRIGGSLDERRLESSVYRYLMSEFRPKIKILKDPLAVAKGACMIWRC